MSYLNAGADWRKRNYLIEPEAAVCANTGAVNRIDPALFVPGSGLITFDLLPSVIGTPNPAYTRAEYSGNIWEPSLVTTRQYLQGQVRTSPFPFMPDGTPPDVPLVLTTPGIPNNQTTNTFTANDGARPVATMTSMVGGPGFVGMQTYLFAEPVVGVKLNLGLINDLGALKIRAYDDLGNVIFSGSSDWIGFSDYAINRDSNVAIIKCLQMWIETDVSGFSSNSMQFSRSCV